MAQRLRFKRGKGKAFDASDAGAVLRQDCSICNGKGRPGRLTGRATARQMRTNRDTGDIIMRIITTVLGLSLAATPALAAPFIAVDASTETIVFLDKGSVTQDGTVAEGDVLYALQPPPNDKPVIFLSKTRADCNANTLGEFDQRILGDDGKVATTLPQDGKMAAIVPGSIGDAVLQTMCTGISPNPSTAGVTHDTLDSALNHARKFLAHHAAAAKVE
jgi:hypothetical protein